MVTDANHCFQCRYFTPEGAICAAPQIGHLVELIVGVETPGWTLLATDARFNESQCGKPGYWFALLPELARP